MLKGSQSFQNSLSEDDKRRCNDFVRQFLSLPPDDGKEKDKAADGSSGEDSLSFPSHPLKVRLVLSLLKQMVQNAGGGEASANKAGAAATKGAGSVVGAMGGGGGAGSIGGAAPAHTSDLVNENKALKLAVMHSPPLWLIASCERWPHPSFCSFGHLVGCDGGENRYSSATMR